MKKISRFISTPKFKYYQKIVFVSVLSVLISALAIYFTLRQTLVKNIINDSVNKLITVMNEQDKILSRTDASISEIASDSNIMNYMKNTTAGQKSKSYNYFMDLGNYRVKNKYIESIFIYYLDEQRVLATDWGSSNIKDYLKYAPEAYTEQKGTRFLVLQTGPAQRDELTGYVNLIRYAPIGYTVRPTAIISVSIGQEFFKAFQTVMNDFGGEYFMIDGKNNFICGNITGIPEDVYSIMNQADFSESNVFYTTIKIGGKEHLFTIVKSDKYDLQYSYYVSMDYITADVDFLMYAIIIITFFVIAASTCMALITVNRLYRPFDSIMNALPKLNAETGDDLMAPDDLAQKIGGIFEENKKLVSLNKDLEGYIEKNKQYQKTLFLLELLNNNGIEIKDNFRYFDIPFQENSFFCAVLFSIDNYPEYVKIYTAEQRNLFTIYLVELNEKEFTPFFICETVKIGEKDTCFILSCNYDYPKPSMETAISETVQKIHETLNKETGVSITVGISEALQGFDSIPSVYQQAKNARDDLWISGPDKIYVFNKTASISREPDYPFDTERDLIHALKSNRQEEAYGSLYRFQTYIRKHFGSDMEFARQYSLQILSSLYRCVYESYSSIYSSLPGEKEMFTVLLGEDSIDTLFIELTNFLSSIFRLLDKIKLYRYSELVEQIKKYIEQNIRNDLSLDRIGDAFSISSSHLRKIFKEEAGTTLKNYIDMVRMKSAQKLLLETNKSINEVTDSVGYLSQQTFMRVFKKETGMTPTEFRRKKSLDSAHLKN